MHPDWHGGGRFGEVVGTFLATAWLSLPSSPPQDFHHMAMNGKSVLGERSARGSSVQMSSLPISSIPTHSNLKFTTSVTNHSLADTRRHDGLTWQSHSLSHQVQWVRERMC